MKRFYLNLSGGDAFSENSSHASCHTTVSAAVSSSTSKFKKSRARSRCCGVVFVVGLVLHIVLTALHLSPLDRIVQEKLLWKLAWKMKILEDADTQYNSQLRIRIHMNDYSDWKCINVHRAWDSRTNISYENTELIQANMLSIHWNVFTTKNMNVEVITVWPKGLQK